MWLVNTGWIGGSAGEVPRMSLKHTRALLTAALEGKLAEIPTQHLPEFGLHVPANCPDVPSEILNPKSMWKDGKKYQEKVRDLAGRFRLNFAQYEERVTADVKAAAPQAS